MPDRRWMFNPGCATAPCCESDAGPCTEIAGNNLVLTCPSGTHTLNAVVGPGNVWAVCFSYTTPYTRDSVIAGCPSVASGLASIDYRLGNCPPYETNEDSTRGLLFAIATSLSPCAASPSGFVQSRTSACSGNTLASPNYTFTFKDVDYTDYPFGATAVPIDFTSGPFSMSFTLPATDQNNYPVPFPGSYVITKA